MFVIGTNQGGLWHPNWNQNLKFAVKIQEKAEQMGQTPKEYVDKMAKMAKELYIS